MSVVKIHGYMLAVQKNCSLPLEKYGEKLSSFQRGCVCLYLMLWCVFTRMFQYSTHNEYYYSSRFGEAECCVDVPLFFHCLCSVTVLRRCDHATNSRTEPQSCMDGDQSALFVICVILQFSSYSTYVLLPCSFRRNKFKVDVRGFLAVKPSSLDRVSIYYFR